MPIILTCASCGQDATVEDPLRPGNCACGASLANGRVSSSAPPPAAPAVSEPAPAASEPAPFTVVPDEGVPYIEPTPSGIRAPGTPVPEPVVQRAPDQPPPVEGPPQLIIPESTVAAVPATDGPPQLVIPHTPPSEPKPVAPPPPGPRPLTIAPPEPEPAPQPRPLNIVPPQAAPAAGGLTCSSCQATVPDGSVICVNCGFNFQTGQAVVATASTEAEEELGPEDFGYETPEEEDGPSLFQRLKPLIKLAVFGIVLAGIGVIVFISMQSRYGVSDETPLGTPAKIQAYFKSIGLEKDGDEANRFGKGKRIRYTNPILKRDTKGRFQESAFLAIDGDGKFVGIGADFWATDMPSGTRVQGFLHSYWKEIGGKPGSEEIDTPIFKAKWNKGTGPMSLGPVHQEDVRIALKGSAFEKEEKERRERMMNPMDSIMIP